MKPGNSKIVTVGNTPHRKRLNPVESVSYII